jgi:glycosyltransferase involved in cell wall biosynthesis
VSKVDPEGIVKKIDIVCFGGQDWWYHNRGHVDMQLMRRFAKHGTTLYVNSIVMQKPTLRKGVGGGKTFTQKLVRKTKSILRGLRKVDEGFWVYSALALPVHHIAWLRPINNFLLWLQMCIVCSWLKIRVPVIWVACPAACEVALKMKKLRLVYQRSDRFEEYPNIDREIVTRYDRKLKEAADLTVFVNKTLCTDEKTQCRKALYLDHGVDFEMFANAEKSENVPEDMRHIKGPVVGFFGGIDSHTLDIAFLENLVKALPQMSFVLVGAVSAEVTELRRNTKVHFLGPKPYEQIPHYGKCFDVCIMPWRQNRWIQACNPIKLKEYLALGKPVISTPFTQLHNYHDVVYAAQTPGDFASAVEKALSENSQEKTLERRDKVRDASWDSKAEVMLEKLFGNGIEKN